MIILSEDLGPEVKRHGTDAWEGGWGGLTIELPSPPHAVGHLQARAGM